MYKIKIIIKYVINYYFSFSSSEVTNNTNSSSSLKYSKTSIPIENDQDSYFFFQPNVNNLYCHFISFVLKTFYIDILFYI